MFQHFLFFFGFKEIKASELLKDPEKLKHIPHQLSSPEKDKQRKCLCLFATLPFAEYQGIVLSFYFCRDLPECMFLFVCWLGMAILFQPLARN